MWDPTPSTSLEPVLRIGGREVGPGRRVFVLAEIGVNHDGEVGRALELVSLAASAGADAVKVQVFRADRLVSGAGVLAAYQRRSTDAQSSAELLRRYELGAEQLHGVLEFARTLGLAAVATPFSPADVELCGQLGLDAVKIASPDIVNTPLLALAARLGPPMLLSTGAATMEEVDAARRLMALTGTPHLLLHCVSSYPAPDAAAHLCFLQDLRRHYGGLIGYSDHATSLLAGALAVAAGAVLIEKHLTYDRAASGPDHAASADPAEFARYVQLIREATTLRGSGHKRVLPEEEDVRRVSRQSLVLARDIAAGEVLTDRHLTIQRPGTGIPARRWADAVGLRARETMAAGRMLSWADLEEAA